MPGRNVNTHWLSQASFVPRALRTARQRRQMAGVVALCLLALLAASRGFLGDLVATSRDLAAARAERALLAAEVERLRTQLALEAATRGELEQHASELNAEVAELTRQVEFLSARRTTVARAN